MKNIKDSNVISNVPGFHASGIYSGIKKDKRKLDLGILFSEKTCSVAGLFTSNKIIAPPLVYDKEILKKGKGQALIVISGNANACTGKKGYDDSRVMAVETANGLNIPVDMVYVASTGVIGEPLPLEKIKDGIPLAVKKLGKDGGRDFAFSIMTTDTFSKEVLLKGKVGGKVVTIGGVAKGSGMISPNMATMLAFIATDAAISRNVLQKALKETCERSFNTITVDGAMSTNDMVLCFANGMAENDKIEYGTKEYESFVKLLLEVSTYLAKLIVKDAEGITKFIEIKVKGAKKYNDAKKIGLTIANSCLVKTAFFGEDANWGRIMAAIGASDVDVIEENIDIYFENIKFVSSGVSKGKEVEAKVAKILQQKEIKVTIDLKLGDIDATIWTSDLSYDYIKINASYRS